MIFKAPQMGVGSRIRVTFYDPETGERIAATNTETGGEFWGGAWHPNLITDAGLDYMAQFDYVQLRNSMGLVADLPEIKESSGAVTASQAGTAVTASGAFFQAEDIGRAIVWADGSNARITAYNSPTSVTVDKTQAVSAQAFERWHTEISSVTATDTATGGSAAIEYDWDGMMLRMTSTITRSVTLGANRNISGVALGPNVGALEAVVESIRDSSGNPITVSLLAGKAVRVDHALVVSVDRSARDVEVQIDEYDAANQLVDTIVMDAQIWVHAARVSNNAANNILNRVLAPSLIGVQPYSANVARFYRERLLNPVTGLVWPGGVWDYQSNTHTYSLVLGAYTPGSRRRTKAMRLRAATAGEIYGVVFASAQSGSGASDAAGVAMQFLEGQPFLKADTHTLEMGFELSWDRDYSVS